eukprot:6070741-Prorocentrum_lima.AAC.1
MPYVDTYAEAAGLCIPNARNSFVSRMPTQDTPTATQSGPRNACSFYTSGCSFRGGTRFCVRALPKADEQRHDAACAFLIPRESA